MKLTSNNVEYASYYFWRTCDKYEIDLIEDKNNVLTGFECKWNETAFTKSQHVFTNEYTDSKIVIVNKDNISDVLCVAT